MLPALRLAIEHNDAAAIAQAIDVYAAILDRLATNMQESAASAAGKMANLPVAAEETP
jgi:hypothetical protein